MDAAPPIASSRRPDPEGSDAGRLASLLRRLVPTESRADTVAWLIVWVVLVAMAVQIVTTVIDNVTFNNSWWPAYDTRAYWLAAQHIINGQPLYQVATISTMGAYKYPPL